MKAMFMAGDMVQHEIHGNILWCNRLLHGFAGGAVGTAWAGNVFSESQDDLDAIAADFRTAFAVPIVVDRIYRGKRATYIPQRSARLLHGLRRMG
jgi:hypothetical protein